MECRQLVFVGLLCGLIAIVLLIEPKLWQSARLNIQQHLWLPANADAVEFPADDPCSFRGRLVAGVCLCGNGFSGSNCELVSRCPVGCTSPNSCPEVTQCFPLALDAVQCPNSCFGHGICLVDNTCACDRSWCSSDCSQRCDTAGVIVTLLSMDTVFQWLRSVDGAFNLRFQHDIIIFVGQDRPLADSAKDKIRSATFSNVDFVEINLAPPDWVNVSLVRHGANNARYLRLGYRGVMRFFGGLMAFHPALDRYKYWFRFDSDLTAVAPHPFDLFLGMEERHAKYGCPRSITLFDLPSYSAAFWPAARDQYLIPNGISVVNGDDPFYWDAASCQSDASNALHACNNYNLRLCNSHFELGDLDFFSQ